MDDVEILSPGPVPGGELADSCLPLRFRPSRQMHEPHSARCSAVQLDSGLTSGFGPKGTDGGATLTVSANVPVPQRLSKTLSAPIALRLSGISWRQEAVPYGSVQRESMKSFGAA